MDNIIVKQFFDVIPLSVTKKLLNISDLLSLKQTPSLKRISYNNRFNLLKSGIDVFVKSGLSLNKIPYIKYANTEYLNLINKENDGNIFSMANMLNNYLEIKHPFEIPVIFDCSLKAEEGFFRPLYIDNNILVFSEYIITGNLSELTPGIYVHEIVHSQLENVRGVKNYLNYEVLTVFFDKLTAIYLDKTKEILKKNEILRYNTLKKSINLLLNEDLPLISKIIASMSISSLLQAEHLFIKYMYGSNNEKNDIMRKIQDIFDGKITVEDLLKDVDISFDNSQDSALIKRHLL